MPQDYRIPLATGAGPLRELFAFDKRIGIDDGLGNKVGDFTEVFRAAAGAIALTGGEAVRAARLEGTQAWSVTIRNHSLAATVTPDWRCRDVRGGKTFAIRAIVTRPGRDYVDLVCIEGEAA